MYLFGFCKGQQNIDSKERKPSSSFVMMVKLLLRNYLIKSPVKLSSHSELPNASVLTLLLVSLIYDSFFILYYYFFFASRSMVGCMRVVCVCVLLWPSRRIGKMRCPLLPSQHCLFKIHNFTGDYHLAVDPKELLKRVFFANTANITLLQYRFSFHRHRR